MTTKTLAEKLLTKVDNMSELNRGLQMPIRAILDLTSIANGTYPHDFIICTNGTRSETWFEVLPASAEIGRKFPDEDSLNKCLSFLNHVIVLGWRCAAVGEKVLYEPDLESTKDFYYPTTKKVQ